MLMAWAGTSLAYPVAQLLLLNFVFGSIHSVSAGGMKGLEQVDDPSQMDQAKSEAMEQAKAARAAKDKGPEPPMDPTGKHPLKRLGTRPLVCSACKTAVKRFETKVARKIKGKWKEEQKRKTFEASLPDACNESSYPEKMYVFDRKDGNGQFFGDSSAMQGGGKLAVKRTGLTVKVSLLIACRHLLFVEFKDALLEKLLSTKANGKDIDFSGWLCGPQQAQVCDKSEDSEEAEEADEEL
mmetsp:Transcript_59019/g.111193  ORF Transcript_59019/g.111193 Transcript_59019/m.111193 type:complete len:239 (+) Transcript_59019:76-792(+)